MTARTPGYDSIAYPQGQLEAASLKPGKVVRNTGNIEEAMGSADNILEASYYLPHLAQAPQWNRWSPLPVSRTRCLA